MPTRTGEGVDAAAKGAKAGGPVPRSHEPSRGEDVSGVTAFAPGSVGNLSCGFDVLGLALEAPGDHVVARRVPEPGVSLGALTGDGGALPRDGETNAATVAARALLDRTMQDREGVALDVHKGLPLCAGMGGSAASAAAAVRAVDALFGFGASEERLLEAALEGERAAAGAPHPDNVAPSLLGGIVLARPRSRRPIVHLPVPPGLAVAVVHQEVQVATRSARRSLGPRIPLEAAVEQWGNTAATVAALHAGDWDLLGDALVDRVAEPLRADRIPGFGAMREAALEAGAVAFGISGAGPAVFAVARSLEGARRAGDAVVEALDRREGVPGRLHVSRAPAPGARIVEPGAEETGIPGDTER